MASLEYFCDEVGISLSDLNRMKAGEVDESVVVKRGLESLRKGFVFGMWNELMVEEKKVSSRRSVINKMREIVCKYFVFDRSDKSFESGVERVIDSWKRSRKDVRSKEKFGKLMENQFYECEQERGNVVDEAGPSEMRQSDVIKNLKQKVIVLERKCEEHMAIKDALCEVSEEKKMLVQKSEGEKKRVDELVAKVEKLKAEKKVKSKQLRMMKRREKHSKVVMEKVRTKSRKRMKKCGEMARRLAEVDVRIKEVVKCNVEKECQLRKEHKLREKELRKEHQLSKKELRKEHKLREKELRKEHQLRENELRKGHQFRENELGKELFKCKVRAEDA